MLILQYTHSHSNKWMEDEGTLCSGVMVWNAYASILDSITTLILDRDFLWQEFHIIVLYLSTLNNCLKSNCSDR